ncbi:SAM-dependent methyltransferase [Nocardia sp. BMG51109]|uniref:SAM-dependent methyltransferase n=1 Tax=Nocardia sp. BMG51109 TaxID=1056816 RepID=UPI0004B533F4|nr:SAM-dependent methyltransferase [Nocardia sp. BMG51109]
MSNTGVRPAPTSLDSSMPTSARMGNYLAGGKDHYEVDRVTAEPILTAAPDTRTAARHSRQFLTDAARRAAEAGIRQFVDLGVGFPLAPTVHRAVHQVDRSARVAVVDFDPVVITHVTALWDHEPHVTVIRADIRDPGEVIGRLRATPWFDRKQPIALLAVDVLHFLTDTEDPAGILARFRQAMAPGSWLALTHASTDTDDELKQQITDATCGTPAEWVFRNAHEVEEFCDGFHLHAPGVAPIQRWLGGDLSDTRLVLSGAVCTKRETTNRV